MRAWGLLAAGLLAAGCGPAGPALYPAGGRVTFKGGGPVTPGVVEFDPGGGRPAARGRLDPDGRFALETDGRPGAVAGVHKVAVVQVSPAGLAGAAHAHKGAAAHRRYASADTSGVAREVTAAGPNEFTIEVDRGD